MVFYLFKMSVDVGKRRRVLPLSFLQSQPRKRYKSDELSNFIENHIGLPTGVHMLVRSFLPISPGSLRHLASWRAVNKQTFQDVESLTKKCLHEDDVNHIPTFFSTWAYVHTTMTLCESCDLFFLPHEQQCVDCTTLCRTCSPPQDYCPSCETYYCSEHEWSFIRECSVCNEHKSRMCENCQETSCQNCEQLVCIDCTDHFGICLDCNQGL